MNWFRERVQLATKKTTRNVNRDGRRWTEDRAGMILRIPIDLREAIKEEARVAGDLSKVVLFALRHVERKDVTITQTRKAWLPLSKPQLLHVGSRHDPCRWKCTRQFNKNRVTSAAPKGRDFATTQVNREGECIPKEDFLSWKIKVTTSRSYIKGLPLVSGIQIQHSAARTNAAPAIENEMPKPCCWAILPTAKGAAALAIRPTL